MWNTQIKIHGAPTFEVEINKLSNSWLITAKNIIYNSNVTKGTFSYKLHSSKNWIMVGEKNYFEVKEHGMYDIKLTDSAGNETIVQAGTNCRLIEDANGNEIPVPNGFSPITTSDQGTKDTGFVIKNDTDGNEFVWIPCTIDGANGSIKYDRYAFTRDGWGATQAKGEYDTKTQSYKITSASVTSTYFTEKLASDEKISVQMYEGFYIGRYESGVEGYSTPISTTSDGTTIWTGYSNGKLVMQANKQVWNYITRDRAKTESEKLYNKTKGDSATSKLCSSYAWDTALKFIETQNITYLTNIVGGNYTGNLKSTGYDTIHPCNIYDMAGNVYEWTTEDCSRESYPYTIRGGYYSTTYAPAAQRSSCSMYYAYIDVGFRSALFL